MKHTLVIVDDHILIAKALSSIIANFPDFTVLYECENGSELQEKLKDKNNIPNIVLLDVSMPIMNGFETAKWLTENHPNVAIIALSMQNEDSSVIAMLKNGAKGYLLKNTYPADLENALLKVMENGFFYPDWAATTIFNNLENQEKAKAALKHSFTTRELEFLEYAATDLSYKEIANKMFCSVRTIENYKESLCTKLNIKSRVGLAVFAIKNDLF
jgi:DNA-binding NarL/FixJ family response regulator